MKYQKAVQAVHDRYKPFVPLFGGKKYTFTGFFAKKHKSGTPVQENIEARKKTLQRCS